MKLLFDENLSFKLCERLGALFPDSMQVRLVGLAQADDREIWDYAGAPMALSLSRSTRISRKEPL